jgi:AcrR family transcriptional regulator/DNA-binding MarR family transcriptional regulator
MATRTRGAVADRSGRSRSTARNLPPSSHVADIQRARLLAGAVRAVDEFGYTHTTVTEITAKAHVSRRTFYELFTNGEDCLAAMLDEAVERVRSQLTEVALGGLPWCERVRGGLCAILHFLDREPALARVCVVQSARGGQRILERREQLLEDLAAVIDQGRNEGDPKTDWPPLTAEGLVGAALSIVHTRLLRGETTPLSELQGELMAMIVLPYLGSAAARSERERPAPTPIVVETAECEGESGVADVRPIDAQRDPLHGISMRLTYRTVCVLEAVAERPGISNRAAADAAGVSDQGQMSKLLARLERYGLLENKRPSTKGEANSWFLTPAGLQVARMVINHAPSGARSGEASR